MIKWTILVHLCSLAFGVFADLCPDASICPGLQTCCPSSTDAETYGCCPYPLGVCCNDGKHCCPPSTMCISWLGMCLPVKKNFNQNLISYASLSKMSVSLEDNSISKSHNLKVENTSCGSTTCPDEFTCCFDLGCCPFPEAVCCPDKKHCCPQDTRCHGSYCETRRDFQAFFRGMKIVHILETKNAPCGSHSCPDTFTCCNDMGCCPLSDAVCCSDYVHCCPQGYTCKNGGCVSSTGRPTSFNRIKAIDIVKSKDTPCGSGSCPDIFTCCNDIGCCPFPEAVCCSDNVHCCPQGYECESGGCVSSFGRPTSFNRIKAIDIVKSKDTPCGSGSCPDIFTCCNDTGCCPFPDAVCCSDDVHCCPQGYECESGGCVSSTSRPTSFSRIKAIDIVKPKDTPCGPGSCPGTSTCCFDAGCCLLPNAVCCDAAHCCPEGYTCSATGCNPAKGSPTVFAGIKSADILKLKDTFYESGSCPQSFTYCDDSGCCPLPDAVCCEDEKHCCPHGYKCNVEEKQCYSSSGYIIPFNEVITSLLKPKDKPCGPGSCPDFATCCGDIGCCPVPDAVCCSDSLHCCPDHFNCCPDNLHCCPQGTICHLEIMKCIAIEGFGTSFSNVIASDLVMAKNSTCMT